MSRIAGALDPGVDLAPTDDPLLRRLAIPVIVAVVTAVIVLTAIVVKSQSAWHLLGVGGGIVEAEYYPLTAFVVTLATMRGPAVGWAAGSALLYHVATAVGIPGGFRLWKVVLTLVYLGLGSLPVLAYHVIFGSPLLGLPREGLVITLRERYPDAHWLLVSAHPFIDSSVILLAVAFLGALWFTGGAPRGSRRVQTVLALAVIGTSLAVALSLAIHSTLVHIRF
jgi:hypothetical protein